MIQKLQSKINKGGLTEQVLTESLTNEHRELLQKRMANLLGQTDGYTAEFFKAKWDIIGVDTILALKFWFDQSHMISSPLK